MNKRLVVFGGSGGLGKPLCDKLKNDYNVIPLSSKDVDVTNFQEVKDFFQSETDIGIVVNFSGYNYSFVSGWSSILLILC